MKGEKNIKKYPSNMKLKMWNEFNWLTMGCNHGIFGNTLMNRRIVYLVVQMENLMTLTLLHVEINKQVNYY
jgi:hypothetical protein